MTDIQFNEDHRDALQEVVNIAMGQAGDSLAKLFNVFVELSIPKFHLHDIQQLRDLLAERPKYQQQMMILRQPFSGQLRGKGLVLFNDNGIHELSGLLGYEGEVTLMNQREMVLDVCSILVSACLNGIAEQLEMPITYTAPSLESSNMLLFLAEDSFPPLISKLDQLLDEL